MCVSVCRYRCDKHTQFVQYNEVHMLNTIIPFSVSTNTLVDQISLGHSSCDNIVVTASVNVGRHIVDMRDNCI